MVATADNAPRRDVTPSVSDVTVTSRRGPVTQCLSVGAGDVGRGQDEAAAVGVRGTGRGGAGILCASTFEPLSGLSADHRLKTDLWLARVRHTPVCWRLWTCSPVCAFTKTRALRPG